MPYRLSTPDLETQAHHIRDVRPSRLLVDSLWAIAIRQIGIDNERAVELIDRARTVADQIGYEIGIALCDIATAMLAINQNEMEKAVAISKSVAAQDVEDEHVQGWLTLLRAHLHYWCWVQEFEGFDSQGTIALSLRAYEELVHVGDVVGMGQALMLIGSSLGSLGDLRAAVAYEFEHYQLNAGLDDAGLLLEPLSQLANGYRLLGSVGVEENCIKEAVTLSRTLYEEKETPAIGNLLEGFTLYYERLQADRHREDRPPHYFPLRYDALLQVQRLLARSQRDDDARRAETGAFTLEPQSEDIEAHIVRMKTLRERDALTGLYHRGYLEEQFPALLVEHHRTQAPLSVLAFVIDRFTPLHTTHRNLYGEMTLHRLGALLIPLTPPPLLPTRYDESRFVIVLPDHNTSDAQRLAGAINDALRTMDGAFTLSGGIAAYQSGDTTETLLNRAFAGLEQAAQTEGDCIQIM